MLNIVTALYLEAEPIIKRFNLKRFGEIYQNNHINLIITGSGKIKSAVKTALLLQKYPYMTLNFGICGSNYYEIGSGFYINKITDTDSGYEYYPDFYKENSREIHTVSKIGKYYRLTDMEASGFFEACYNFLTVEKIVLFKIVSDTPDNPPQKKTIREIVNKHINVIENLLEITTERNKNEEIDLIFNEITSKMKLTKSQQAKVKNLITYLYLTNKKIPHIPFLRKKEEVREFITNLSFLALS